MFSWGLTALVMSLVFGTALMVIPNVPQWLGAIIALVLLGFYSIAVILAKGAAEVVYNVGQKVAAETAFIKNLTVDAENLISKANSDEAKAVATKVYEAIRYSNKSSHDGLDEIESKISEKFIEFDEAIVSDDNELSKSLCDQIIDLIQERNNLSKTIK